LGSQQYLPAEHVDAREVDMVNAALYLRRPLLVTGRPGSGKSSLAYRIARELNLGRVLRWPITSHTTLTTGLYSYDAIARAQAAAARFAAPAEDGARPVEPPIGEYLRLNELGTGFLARRVPRVLLIDELDKSEADLPNDLLSLFEDGEFLIPELARVRSRMPEVEVFTADPDVTATITAGRVRCRAFPVVVITSNGERDFPPAFLRRCLRLEMRNPDIRQLTAMVAAHALDPADEHRSRIIEDFVSRSEAHGGLPADKLLEAVYLATSGAYGQNTDSWPRLVDALWRQLNSMVP
jgi:MoxR-like ATPase